MHPLTRPTKYPSRKPDVAASMAMQMPPSPDMQTDGQGTAQAFPGLAEAAEGRPDQGRDRLLSRIAESRVPQRQLCLLLLESEGLACFTDQALQRMAAVLDIIETQLETDNPAVRNSPDPAP